MVKLEDIKIGLKKFLWRHKIFYTVARFLYVGLNPKIRKLTINNRRYEKNLTSILGNRRDIFFIQVGSNDGVANDPLRRFIVANNWGGMLLNRCHIYFQS